MEHIESDGNKNNGCVARESNPGRKNGNLAWYHYTSDAHWTLWQCRLKVKKKFLFWAQVLLGKLDSKSTARLAQSVEHETLNLRVVGSSPTLGAIVLAKILASLLKQNCRDPGSNRGPLDLQSNALPTELSRLSCSTTVVVFCWLIK